MNNVAYETLFYVALALFTGLFTILFFMIQNWVSKINSNFTLLFSMVDNLTKSIDFKELEKAVQLDHDRITILETHIKSCKSCNPK